MDRSSYIYSAGLHATVIAVAIFGLPLFEIERLPEPPVIIAEMAPLSEKSNVPKVQPTPVEAKAEPKPEPEPPKPEAKPEPPKPAPAAAPPPPPPAPPEPPRPVEAAKPAPAPEPVPGPKPLPKTEKPPEPPAPAPPKPAEKPAPPRPAPPAPTQAKAPDFSDVAALVNKMQKTPPAPPPPTPAPRVAAAAPPSPAPRAVGPSNPNLPLSISEKDFIASQIYDKWNLDCGRRDARDHVVRIQFMLNPDGTLKTQPEVLDSARLYVQEHYRAAAESARRAVHKAVPFKFPAGVDVSKFTQEIVLNFDPRQQCNS